MKKIITTILSLLFLLVGVCFVGCGKPQTNSSISYYGIMQTQEGSEELYVYIPQIGYCIFPEYKDGADKIVIKGGHVYEEPLKEGDVVGLKFGEHVNASFLEEMQFDEITGKYYTVFSKPVESVWIYKENVALKQDGDAWFLTVAYEDYRDNDESECVVGEIAELWTAQFLTGEGDGKGSYESGSAQIVEIESGCVTLRLDLNDNNIHKFLHHFATGALAFRRIPISGFSFSLTWGTFGISSYDSTTGKLVKTKDEPNLENYMTTYYLTAEEKTRIYEIILELDMTSYPDVYNPTEGKGSIPSQDLILSVCSEKLNKTITAEDVALSDATSERGQKFMDTCRAISEILMATDEWKALPDYPYLYD